FSEKLRIQDDARHFGTIQKRTIFVIIVILTLFYIKFPYIKVNINTLLIKDFNDDEVNDFLQLINYNPVNVRFIELDENKIDINIYENGYLDVEKYLNGIEGLYKTSDNTYTYNYAKGNIIIKNNCGSCEDCSKIELTKDGKIILCSEIKSEADITYYLDRPLIFREILKDIIIEKPKGLI
ncbi:MAG: hypothetical protein IJH34_11560, partial [Romboutsia sp.]|nr:hypothetical protein [Romboutsia sp.]